jgi:hypothetical protein
MWIMFYQGFEALIAIDDGAVIAGSLPRGALRIIQPWIARRRAQLLENWKRGRRGEPFERVPGADSE